jgi:hypothetical protein
MRSLVLVAALISLIGSNAVRAATYSTIIDPANTSFTEALGINNSGTIVGYGNASTPNGFVLTPPSTFARQNFPGADGGTQVRGIDSAGSTVGSSTTAGITSGFYQSGGTFTPVNQPGTVFNRLLGINQAGTIAAGYASSTDTAGATGQQAYTYNFSSLTFTNISTLLPANTNGQATGLNNSGMIVGFYQLLSGKYSAFSDVGGTITSFLVPGSTSTQALGVNDLGRIVGDYVDGSGTMFGFLDIGGTFTTIDPPGAVSTTANGINDLGQIVGFYTDATGATLGFETSTAATPLPAALPLFATGLGGLGLLGWRRKRRTRTGA